MSTHFRHDDVEFRVVEVTTMFNEFMKRYEEDAKATKEWREKFEREMSEIRDLVRPLLVPYRIMVVVLTITGTVFLTKFAGEVFRWLRAHF